MVSSTVFVSNFPFATTEAELRARFEELSGVRSVRIIVDRETGRSRGFAFVELADPGAIDTVIEALDNSDFKGRRLAVSRARGRAGASPDGEARLRAPMVRSERGPRAPQSLAEPLRHRVIIDWVDTENAYAASVPDLGISVQAPSIEGAAREARERALRELATHGASSESVG